MQKYRVWEKGIYKAEIIEARHVHAAVKQFAKTNVDCLNSIQYVASGLTKSNPGRFIALDGSAREFTAYPVIVLDNF